MSFRVAVELNWTAALPDVDLRTPKHLRKPKYLEDQNQFHYYDSISLYEIVFLTTGGSLPSLLPSDVLPSEPQDVGEHSRFWAGLQDKGC